MIATKRLALTICPICGESTLVRIETETFRNWTSGAINAQDIEGLDDDDKERLLSGICPKCWKEEVEIIR